MRNEFTRNMEVKDRFIKRYEEGFMPWAHSEPDFNLIEMVQNWPIKVCKTAEIGCGTGTDAIWLASQKFKTTAIDSSTVAIDIAKENARKEKSNCHFDVCDFMTENIEGAPFDFIFDRGFFHSFDTLSDRKIFAERVSKALTEKGLWLSLIGSSDDLPRKRGNGPPQRSAQEIIKAAEPYFKILSLSVSFFGSESERPAKIWVCLMRKR